MRRWKLQGIASRVQGKTPMQDLFVILPTGCAPTSLNVCEQTRLSWIQTYASPVALTIRNVTTDNYSHGFQEVRVILWDVKGIWGSSCYRISLILPSRFYSGNIHLVSLPISFFFFFCLTPLSLSLSLSLSPSLGNTPTQTVISALTLWLSLLVSQCLWSVSEGEDQTAPSGNLNSVCLFLSFSLSLSLSLSLCAPPPLSLSLSSSRLLSTSPFSCLSLPPYYHFTCQLWQTSSLFVAAVPGVFFIFFLFICHWVLYTM